MGKPRPRPGRPMSRDPARRIRSKTPPPRNYFSRREQYRLLILVTMFMLVLIMMNEARKPQNWRWMWQGQDAGQLAGNENAAPIDTRLPPTQERELPADGFTTPPQQGPDSVEPQDAAYLPGITAELLSTIEDDTVLRSSESQAWMAIFRVLQQRTQAELERLPSSRVGFIQLFRQTDFYRGRLVTVSGTVRRREEIAARANELGIERYVRWILAPQGGANSPIVVYTLESPDQFPNGAEVREPASFTGFCYKRWAYPAGDGTRVAPLILAKTANWQPTAPPAPPPAPSTTWLAALVAGLAILAVSIAFAVYSSSRRLSPHVVRTRRTEVRGLDELSRENILPQVSEVLEDLAHGGRRNHGDRSDREA